jgi:hypothetical protein
MNRRPRANSPSWSALALPAVGLAVEPQLAINLPTGAAKRPDTLAQCVLSGKRRRAVRREPIVVGHRTDRIAPSDRTGRLRSCANFGPLIAFHCTVMRDTV